MGTDLDAIGRLLSAAARVKGGDRLTTELLTEEQVPVPVRLLVAAAALAGADQPLTKKSITEAAPAARSAVYREHKDLLDALQDLLPSLVAAQLQPVVREVTVAEVTRQLELANATVEEERKLRDQAEADLAQVVAYARELHWRLKPEYDDMVRERAAKVRPLRPVDEPKD